MSEKIPVENAAAVSKRETETGDEAPDKTGPFPRRWAGIVVRNWGPWVEKGYTTGEWRIEIKSDSLQVKSEGLQETVTARVNEDRKVGEQVQFKLDEIVMSPPTFPNGPPITLGRMTTSAIFQKMRNKRSKNPDEWIDHPEWREGMFRE